MRRVIVLLGLVLLSPNMGAQELVQKPGTTPGFVTEDGSVDPTKNVLNLVEAAIKRQDDLRKALEALIDSQMKFQAEINKDIQQRLTTIQTRISALEQIGATGIGRQSVQDPVLIELAKEVQRLSRAQAESQAKSESYAWLWGVAVVVAGLIIGLTTVLMNFRRSRTGV